MAYWVWVFARFFQFEVVRKSEDGWICLESLLWMSLIWWFVWSVLGVFPKTLDPDLDLPSVCASNFNTTPGVSTAYLKLLLNLSHEAWSTDHCWNSTWITGSRVKSLLLIHATSWLHWSCWIKSFGVGGQSVWGKRKNIAWSRAFGDDNKLKRLLFLSLVNLVKCQNRKTSFKDD